MRNYEDLQVWRKAHNLTLAIYKATQCFPADERFGLTSQIRRSCASIELISPKVGEEGRTQRWVDSYKFRWGLAPSFRTTCYWLATCGLRKRKSKAFQLSPFSRNQTFIQLRSELGEVMDALGLVAEGQADRASDSAKG